jgi:hypothetical protein
MSDAGEGLVDAEARLQEQMDAREQDRRRRGSQTFKDPEKMRQQESLRLAHVELEHQLGATTHPVRREQINHALAELDKRIKLAAV